MVLDPSSAVATSTDRLARAPERGRTGSERLSNCRLPVALPTRLAPSRIMKSMGIFRPSGSVWISSRGSWAESCSCRNETDAWKLAGNSSPAVSTPPIRRTRVATNRPGSLSSAAPDAR